MSPPVTKSRHLDKYPYFLNYNDPNDIPYNQLAKRLNVHPNLLRGMIRSARSNSTIYAALRKMGYIDSQIPPWFSHPNEPLAYRRAAPAGPSVSAEKRSGADDRSEPAKGDTLPTRGVAQERSAERLSGLSVRSAPPANVYALVQPVYQPPINPMLEEVLQQIRETQEEEMRYSLERTRRRRAPPKPISLDELRVRAEANNIMWQIEARNAAQMMLMMDMFRASNTSKPVDIEKIEELFTEQFEEIRLRNETERDEQKEALTAVGKLFIDLMPTAGPDITFMRQYKAALTRKRDNEREAMIGLAEILVERRARTSPLKPYARARATSWLFIGFPSS